MEQIQITLFDKENRYRPVSAIVKVESKEWFSSHKEEVRTQGIIKICQKRYWNAKDLNKYGYTTCKMRVYKGENI